MIPQVDSAAADPSQHQLPAAPHRAGDGAAGAGGLGGRGVRPQLRPPQPRHRPQGHHARVHGAAPSAGETIQQNEFVPTLNARIFVHIFKIPFKCISISIQLP